jgi:hypothetical protein
MEAKKYNSTAFVLDFTNACEYACDKKKNCCKKYKKKGKFCGGCPKK